MATGGRIVRVPHLVNDTRIVLLEDVYKYIGIICGITKLTGQTPPDSETGDIQDLVKHGIIRRAKVRVNNLSSDPSASPYITRIVYLSASQAAQVGGLVGLKLTDNVTIRSAYFPQKITLG